jgi:predicted dehydrogenase
MSQHDQPHNASRRAFMKQAAVGAGVLALGANASHAATGGTIRVGVVGCGRRGCGAARNAIQASDDVRIVALADLFEDQLASGREKLATLGDAVQAGDDDCHVGFDAYKAVLAADIDYVILATPPAYRPAMLEAAVAAGKHVFMEKPAAVDPEGVRRVIAAGEEAKKKGLTIVAGTQRRHQAPYVDLIGRIHEGAIGDIVSGSCYWVGDYGYYPAVLRKDDWSDMEYHNRNWNYFTWLSGDHIVEQHVHNIDIMNWALQAHPVKAIALGGRQQRTGEEFGHIYDHFSVEFEYPGGVRIHSYCRQNKDTYRRVAEHLVGTNGTADPRQGIEGANAYKFSGEETDPYVQEHADLIASMRNGDGLNEARANAESTMAAIIGRMSAYTGQEVTWDFAMNESKLNLVPEKLMFGELPEVSVAIPGETPLL